MNCEKYFDVIPWPQVVIVVAVSFSIGGVLGYLAGRHTALRPSRETKGNDMTVRQKWYSLSLGETWLNQHPRLAATYTRVAPVLVVFALCASVWASIGTWQNSRDTSALTKANQANLVTNCQNANESRAATLSLWNFLFNSALSNPHAPAQQVANVAAVKAWIAKLYAQRDCTDLSKKYPIPPPPTIRPVA